MKKLFLIGLFLCSAAFAADKFLKYKFNDNVEIIISNVVCPIKSLKDKYEWAVVANRIDGQHLFGCFTHKGDDIVIQWAGGDQTILPANAFLQPDT